MVSIYIYNDFPHSDCGLIGESKNLEFLGKNYVFTTNAKDADIIIFFDYKKNKKLDLFLSFYRNKFLVLVRTEPPSVLNEQYERFESFSLILDLGKYNRIDNKVIFLEWPICSNYFEKRDLYCATIPGSIILVNSNKFGNFNFYYSLRRKIVYNLSNVIKVVGSGWSIVDFNYRNFIGTVLHQVRNLSFNEISKMNPLIHRLFCFPKSSTLSKGELFKNFETVLIIENDPSYFSEKIIEALLLRKNIIYIGGKIDCLPKILHKHILTPEHNFIEIKNVIEDVYSLRYLFPEIRTLDTPNLLQNWEAKTVWCKLISFTIESYSSTR